MFSRAVAAALLLLNIRLIYIYTRRTHPSPRTTRTSRTLTKAHYTFLCVKRPLLYYHRQIRCFRQIICLRKGTLYIEGYNIKEPPQEFEVGSGKR